MTTFDSGYAYLVDGNFNPRHREGDDAYWLGGWDLLLNFNPRHREGDDAIPANSRVRLMDFNPRHREGDDLAPWTFIIAKGEFQSTSPRR